MAVNASEKEPSLERQWGRKRFFQAPIPGSSWDKEISLKDVHVNGLLLLFLYPQGVQSSGQWGPDWGGVCLGGEEFSQLKRSLK